MFTKAHSIYFAISEGQGNFFEKSGKSQGILIRISSGNPFPFSIFMGISVMWMAFLESNVLISLTISGTDPLWYGILEI